MASSNGPSDMEQVRALAAAQQQQMLQATPVSGAGNEGGGALSEVDFSTLMTVTRKSMLWLVLLVILSLAAAQLFIRYTRPLYQSTSILKIDEESEANQLGFDFMNQRPSVGTKVNRLGGEVELIKSEMLYTRLKDS